MFENNPSFSSVPEMPPGTAALPYFFGNLISGGMTTPYVPMNQSVHDAWMSKYVNDPIYKNVMGRVYGQMGAQIGAGAGNTYFFKQLARMSGYAPERIRADMTNFGWDVGSSAVGSFLMPVADALMAQSGLSGGSFIGAARNVIDASMSLLPPTDLVNPYDAGRQHQSMGAVSSMLGLLNGAISRRDGAGNLMPMPDLAFTQGFSRETISKLAMQMAGAGGLTTSQGSLVQRLTKAANGYDIADLNVSLGDFSGGGASSNISGKTAEDVKKVSDDFKKRMESGIKVMGAMRDLLKEVDGGMEKLTALTNGDWLRSQGGMDSALSAVRRLDAVTKVYDRDPKEAWSDLVANRSTLQAAAGFTPALQAAGFDGGGMFRLGAQTDFLANVESMITARGVRGDPLKANALRGQALQAMSRNMNTQAGVAAQVLAYGRQLGVISEKDAETFRSGLTSGDQSVMGESLNRMLTTVFGSAKKGRELMQDSMFVNSMRQSLNDESGRYALGTIMKGADREFMRQETVTAAADRANFSRRLLSGAGMRMKPSDAEVGRLVDSAVATLTEADGGGSALGAAFHEQVANRVSGGMNRYAAYQATMRAFETNPATAQFAERLKVAANRQTAENNEYAYREGGLESGQAKALADALRASGLITGKQHGSITKMIRDGRGAEALSQVNGITSGLSGAQQELFKRVKDDATQKYEVAVQTIDDKKAAEALVTKAGKTGFGSDAVVGSFTSVIDAAREYLKSGRKDADFDKLQDVFAKSRYASIFGNESGDAFLKAMRGPDAEKMVAAMGRQSVQLRQFAVSNLQKNGYGLSSSGYWGGGLYAGNSEELAKKRDAVIKAVAGNIDEASVKGAGARSTLAQDFVDFLTGDKNWKQVLKIDDKNSPFAGVTREYAKAYDAYEKKREAYAAKEKDISAVVNRLNRADKFDAARELQGMVGKYKEADLEAFMQKNGIAGEEADKLREAMSASQAVRVRREAADKALVNMSDKKGFSDAAAAFGVRKKELDRQKARYGAVGAFMDELDVSEMAKASGKMKEAYASAESAVSAEKLAKYMGISTDALSKLGKTEEGKASIARGRLDLVKAQASAGDTASMAAMEKFSAARAEARGKISGELTLKVGNEQYPAMLSGSIGGLS